MSRCRSRCNDGSCRTACRADWQISADGDKDVTVTVPGRLHALIEDMRSSKVTSAGQVPTGFDPETALSVAQPSARSRTDDLRRVRRSALVRHRLGRAAADRPARPVRRVFRQRHGSARLRRHRRDDAVGVDGQARDVEAAAARPVRDAGRFHQCVRARQPRRHRRDHRRVRDVPVQPAPRRRRHSERTAPRGDGRQLRSADHAGDHRRLSHHGRARRRRGADAARRPHRRGRQPARVPAVLRQLRLHAVGSCGLYGADGRRARTRTRPDDSRAPSRTFTSTPTATRSRFRDPASATT